MNAHPEHVVVIGAGMVGLSTAWYLQSENVRVTVVDRTGVAAGSSWGNAGWLAPALTLPLPDPAMVSIGIRAVLSPSSPVYVPPRADTKLARFLAGFLRHSTPGQWRSAMRIFARANDMALDAYDELARANTGAVAEPTKPSQPFFCVFASESDRGDLIKEFDGVRQAGGQVEYDLLDRREITSIEPALGPGANYGLNLHHQRFINPPKYMGALADAVVARGGEVIDGVHVSRVEAADGGVRVHRADGSEITADAAVIASGTWLGDLAREHGVRKIVHAGRGYSFTVYPDKVPHGPVYLPTQRVACTPLGSHEEGFRVTGMMEFRRPGDPLDQRRIRAIIDAAAPMFSGIDWSHRTDEWVGSRPCTTDGLPLVGPSATENVWVAGGHGMWGVALGPLTGKLLAARMTRGDIDPLLDAFDPLR